MAGAIMVIALTRTAVVDWLNYGDTGLHATIQNGPIPSSVDHADSDFGVARLHRVRDFVNEARRHVMDALASRLRAARLQAVLHRLLEEAL
jgi:hypothetical protein